VQNEGQALDFHVESVHVPRLYLPTPEVTSGTRHSLFDRQVCPLKQQNVGSGPAVQGTSGVARVPSGQKQGDTVADVS
jgi:hypothetical protein